MKKVAGQIILALVAGRHNGGAFWVPAGSRAALPMLTRSSRSSATPRSTLSTGDIDQAMTYVRRVPWVADGLVDDVEEHRAASEYWRAHYDALARSATPPAR